MAHLTLTALRKLLSGAKTESGEKNVVMKALRVDGYRTMPSVSTHRSGNRTVRVYLWRKSPMGDLALMAGPSIEGALYKVTPVTGDVHAEDVNLYIPARGRIPAYAAWKPGKGPTKPKPRSRAKKRTNNAQRRWQRFSAVTPYYYGRENPMRDLIADHIASISDILEGAEAEGLEVETSRVCPNGVIATRGVKQAKELAHGGPFRAPHPSISVKLIDEEVKTAQGGVLYLERITNFSTAQIASLGAALRKYPNVVVAYSGYGNWETPGIGYTPDDPAAVNERLRLLGVSGPYPEAEAEPAGMTGQQLVNLIRSVADTGNEAEADQAIDDAPNPVILDATMIEGLGSAAFGNEAQMRESLKEAVGTYYNDYQDGTGLYASDEPEAPSDEEVAAELEKLLGAEPEPARSRQEKMEERLRERMEKKATEEAEAKAALQPAESASEDDEVLAILGLTPKTNRRNRRNPRARRNPELGEATITVLTTHLVRQGHSAEDAAGVAAMVAKAVANVEGKTGPEIATLVVQNLGPLLSLYFKRKGEEAPEVVVEEPAVIEPDEPSISDAEARAEIEKRIRAKIKEVIAAGGAVTTSADAPEDRATAMERRLQERLEKKAGKRTLVAGTPVKKPKPKRVKDEPAQATAPKESRADAMKRRLEERLAAKKTKNPRRNPYMR